MAQARVILGHMRRKMGRALEHILKSKKEMMRSGKAKEVRKKNQNHGDLERKVMQRGNHQSKVIRISNLTLLRIPVGLIREYLVRFVVCTIMKQGIAGESFVRFVG